MTLEQAKALGYTITLMRLMDGMFYFIHNSQGKLVWAISLLANMADPNTAQTEEEAWEATGLGG